MGSGYLGAGSDNFPEEGIKRMISGGGQFAGGLVAGGNIGVVTGRIAGLEGKFPKKRFKFSHKSEYNRMV